MAKENVEIVRRYAESLGQFMAALRANPGPVSETPFIDEFFDCLDPEVEWRWPLNDEAFRGREAMLQAATDFLDAVDEWNIDVDEIVDAGNDRLFVAHRVSARGKEAERRSSRVCSRRSEFATARSRKSTTTPSEPRPSKPWGWRSRCGEFR